MNGPADESDYRPTVTAGQTLGFLPGTGIEVIRRRDRGLRPEHVLFDFDGTLSLIREGWPEVMVPMMVEVLQETGTQESADELRHLVLDFVMELNGKQTIYQMIRLAEEVSRRGGRPLAPLQYKHRYHDLLMRRIEGRLEGLRSGRISRQELLVPHALDLLEALRDRGARLYLASGTDEHYVREEAALLGLDEYFGAEIHGAVDDFKTFSKAMVIARILAANRVDGSRLVGFGDGYVEIMNIKASGGTAVAVASDEAGRSGKPDPWKRERLVGVGADLVIPDYRDASALVDYLWNRDGSLAS